MNKETKEWIIALGLGLATAAIIVLGAVYVSLKNYAAFYGIEI